MINVIREIRKSLVLANQAQLLDLTEYSYVTRSLKVAETIFKAEMESFLNYQIHAQFTVLETKYQIEILLWINNTDDQPHKFIFDDKKFYSIDTQNETLKHTSLTNSIRNFMQKKSVYWSEHDNLTDVIYKKTPIYLWGV